MLYKSQYIISLISGPVTTSTGLEKVISKILKKPHWVLVVWSETRKNETQSKVKHQVKCMLSENVAHWLGLNRRCPLWSMEASHPSNLSYLLHMNEQSEVAWPGLACTLLGGTKPCSLFLMGPNTVRRHNSDSTEHMTWVCLLSHRLNVPVPHLNLTQSTSLCFSVWAS